MTDRIHSITLALDEDIRVDDAEALIAACLQLRGVVGAKGDVSDHNTFMAETRIRMEFQRRLFGELSK